MKLYELKIEDNEDEVFAISLVESPAIESERDNHTMCILPKRRLRRLHRIT